MDVMDDDESREPETREKRHFMVILSDVCQGRITARLDPDKFSEMIMEQLVTPSQGQSSFKFFHQSCLALSTVELLFHKCGQEDPQNESAKSQFVPFSFRTKWYQQVTKFLCSSGINQILIDCLLFRCQFTSHTAKRALLSGFQSGHFQVDEILSCLAKRSDDQDGDSQFKTIGFLRTVFSRNITISNWTDLTHLIDCYHKKYIPRPQGQNSTHQPEVVIEFVWLLNKICKFHQRTSSVPESLYFNIVRQLTTLLNSMCSSVNPAGHVLSIKILKAVCSVLDVQSLEAQTTVPETVLYMAQSITPALPRLLFLDNDSELFSPVNFVGNSVNELLSRRDMDSTINHPVSSVTRMLVHVALKCCSILMYSSPTLENLELIRQVLYKDLKVFLQRVLKKEWISIEWLPHVFSDHDQMWIMSLFCLMIIHDQIRRMNEDDQHTSVAVPSSPASHYNNEEGGIADKTAISPCMDTEISHTSSEVSYSSTVKPNSSTEVPYSSTEIPLNLKQYLTELDPSILFLQFMRFVDFDHITVADFLLSPETLFLNYFTMLLHYLKRSWASFRLTCECLESNQNASHSHDIVQQHINVEEEKGIQSCKVKRKKSDSNSASISRERRKKVCTTFEKEKDDRNDNFSSANLVSYSDSDDSEDVESGKQDWRTDVKGEHPVKDIQEDMDDICRSSDEHSDSSESVQFVDSNQVSSLSCVGSETLDQVMGMLIRLRFHLERLSRNSLISFSIKPVIALITACEDHYENVVQ